MLTKTMLLLLAVIAAAAAPALANDTSAELSTGGLVFVRNEQIELRSEDLSISTKEISVNYRFFSTADKPMTVLVAFPMPDIRVEGQDQIISVPTEDPVNLLDFKTKVNGERVSTQVEQRVVALGLDRTALLRSLGIPLAPHLRSTNDALDQLPREKWDDLLRLGLAEIERYDTGKGFEEHLAARWSLSTTFYWEQTFAPQTETLVEHRYQPSVGESVQTSLGEPSAMKEDWYTEYRNRYCIDKEFYGAVDRARRDARSQFGAPYSEQRIEYVLRTGANWSGPIKDFRLLVDKGAADSLVSFCGSGVQKIGETQFEMKKNDFIPDDDIAVLILKRLPRR